MLRRAMLLGLMAVSLALPAAAEESGVPHLDEHRFVPVPELIEPFMTTHVQMTVALGWTTNATQPLFSPVDSTQVGNVSSDQFITGLGVVYQQGVKDWMVVRLRLDIVGRLGTDTSSLLSSGVTGAVGYEIGWMLRVYRSQSVLVSGSVGLGSANATFVDISAWQEAQSAGEDAELVRPRTSLSGSGGLHAAWGINRRFGLLGAVEASYGESFDGSGDNAWYSDLRFALSYDAAQDLNTPLGLALTAGRTENDVNADTGAGTWFWNLRLAGMREDFTIGVALQNSYFESADQDDRVQFLDIKFDMRYFY